MRDTLVPRGEGDYNYHNVAFKGKGRILIMRQTRRIVPVVILTLLLGLTGPAHACPNCKEAVSAQPSEVASMARGYNWSVLFMIAVPFTMLGTGTLMVVRAARRGALPEL
jgi:hypothetical protein